MSVKEILKKLSDGITLISEKIFIFYPTGKSKRSIMNIIYIVALMFCAMAIVSYEYTPVENQYINTTKNISNFGSYFNTTITSQVSDEPVIIEKPRFLVENRHIRLVVGLLVSYFIISFLYSNTLHTKLNEFDTRETLTKVANGDEPV